MRKMLTEERCRDKLLEVKNLTYLYNEEKEALKNITLSIYEGERIAVLGANGAGKSTLFLNMNGVLTPHEGEIFYRGKKITGKDLNELRKNIGIVFQEADNQIIASTVLAEVSFGPMNLKLPSKEVEQRVEEALSYMGISDFKNRPPHYLSGGEKKRVSIADIIAMKPEIFIFDEPAASLDPYHTKMLEEVLSRLSEEKKTLLISTHDVDFAYRFAERVLVFSGGELIADAAPLEVFQNQEILAEANLKTPVLFQMYEMLKEAGKVSGEGAYPRTVQEFQKLVAGS
ncbi:MAG: energy-coupling factor ABC transporter ATP-binding protein [Roseburia sp.]|nr:energy-coupling factor ABC transporter ATP-binding protein [Roseburia sp.]MCM1278198.1 energy-coupling factor ABC transporter ATP-binding protein [Robinsoniella sp.]